jgi:transcriptional regulator with XRE-family HTH domain
LLRARRDSPPAVSAEDVARRAGLSVETVRRIEKQATPDPGFFTVARIARSLGLSLDYVADQTLEIPNE